MKSQAEHEVRANNKTNPLISSAQLNFEQTRFIPGFNI